MSAAMDVDVLSELEAVFDPNASILEEFLESVGTLPPEIKRVATLLREVDAKAAVDLQLLKKAQEDHLDAVAKNAPGAAELGEHVIIHKKRLDARLNEKTVLVAQMFDLTDKHANRLKRDITNFQNLLRPTGELEESNLPDPFAPFTAAPPPHVQPAQPVASHHVTPLPSSRRASSHNAAHTGGNGGVAANFDPSKYPIGASCAARTNAEENLWILARIIDVNASAGVITVEDPDEPEKKYVVRPKHISVLVENEDLSHARSRLGNTKNKQVMAMYPETTTFYIAVIATPPFRAPANHPDPNLAGKVCVSCLFNDDEDATGVTPKRNVLSRLVIVI